MPPGVDAALWTYASTERLADEESGYFEGHPLLEADLRWVGEHVGDARALVDLGCGTGRAALALANERRWVAAVDLSLPMLRKLKRAAEKGGQEIVCVRGNLCSHLAFRSTTFDVALLLFSTLGMIRGRGRRRFALAEARRIVRPGGVLFLHVHNVAENLRNPKGRWWLLGQLAAWVLRRPYAGDRAMTYRGIPNLVVHQYRWRELAADLRSAGWQVQERRAIDARTARPVRLAWLLPALRAGGWLVEARAIDRASICTNGQGVDRSKYPADAL
jgi:SAM-dependent methyltransferase